MITFNSENKQKKAIIEAYEDKKTVETFDFERSLYAYQRFKHKKESQVLKNAIKSINEDKVKVLDVACGTGRMIPPAHSCGKLVDYYGIDTSQTMLDSINEWFHTPSKIIKGDATKLPFEDNSFDVVFTFHLLWHLPPEVQAEVLDEMERVCKPGGVIVFDVINDNFWFGKKTEGIYKWKHWKFMWGRNSKIDKLNDFPVKSSLLYGLLNIVNYIEKVLPANLFHMLYFTKRIKN